MSVVAFSPPNHRLHLPSYSASIFSLHTMGADSISDQRLLNATDGISTSTTLILRKLPRNTSTEVVRTMLLFSEDFQDAELINSELPEDNGFVTAAARFSSVAGASEAQTKLDGKPNATGKANMIVEMLSTSGSSNGRRSTVEPIAPRNIMQPISPPPSQMHKASRFNDAFQSFDKLSPPPVGSPHDSLASENKSVNGMFSSKQLQDNFRVTGKSVIDEDVADDETGQLLKDPLAYMKNDSSIVYGIPRQHSNPRMPIGQFNSLSLNTNMNTTSASSFASPRSALHASTPNNAFSPGGNAFSAGGNQYLRHNYPPVNPADQNPPCNTLYVGNLPMDTSEDELKAMFSKQRGYKRLCFRTKQNGPMCFVEFEDISFATKALNELYGVQLHNSVKGGIRLSFSKNPLGVRSGQPGSNNPSTPLSPSAGMMNPMSPLSPGGFTTANGPPPGLSAPPGLHMSNPVSPNAQTGQFPNQSFPLGMSPLPNGRMGSMSNGSNGQQLNNGYPDYMMGR